MQRSFSRSAMAAPGRVDWLEVRILALLRRLLTTKALANAFVEESVKKNGSDPFRVAWYKSDTTQSINYLKAEVVDVAITYTQSAEEVAVRAGVAKSSFPTS